MKLDTHQHFWIYDPIAYNWIDNEMSALKRNFLPEDLLPILKENGIDGCIAVQARQSEMETHFLLELAAQNDFIKGVVGWVNLVADDLIERLEYYANFEKLKGFRHIVQSEPDPNYLLRPKFLKGLKAFKKFGYTYDILVFPHQLGAVLELVRLLPEQAFVIDHLAKPYIKDGFFDGWSVLMKAIAKYPNVYCKLSGMVTEAEWSNWSQDDFQPYLDVVLECFGAERTMFGSDWPVCLLSGTYHQVKRIIELYIAELSTEEQAAIWGGNGAKFYSIF